MSKRDFIPLMRCAGALVCYGPIQDHFFPNYSLKHFNELKFLSPHKGTKLIDHNFDSPTFKNEIKNSTEKYFKLNGEL